uniref:Protein SGT1 homolog n=1 Tax=Mandrillus leucophaeus TaxID=9568 RepID=A0A2K5ZLS3_MANLE
MAAAAAGTATSQRFFQSFSDALIDEDPQAALEELTKALEEKPDDAQYYCQRAYCHILLGNYCVAVADAKKSLKLNPNNSTAMLRKGICEYHEKNYAAALETFTEGQKLDIETGFRRVGQAGLKLLTSSDPPALTSQSAGVTAMSADANFSVWIKRCQEAQNGMYDWYQTESQVVITLMIKNVQKNDVNVEFSEKELSALVKLPSGEDYNLKLELLHPIIPEQSTFKVLSTKIEIKLKKPEAVRWEKLEGQGDVPTPKQFVADVKNLYPSSSPYTRNWDKLVGEIKEEEKNEKLEGDAALNRLFQQIYSDGSDEVKRAMNKSFMESGGTVLSTNWSDVGKRKVEINPPDDMEWKKY